MYVCVPVLGNEMMRRGVRVGYGVLSSTLVDGRWPKVQSKHKPQGAPEEGAGGCEWTSGQREGEKTPAHGHSGTQGGARAWAYLVLQSAPCLDHLQEVGGTLGRNYRGAAAYLPQFTVWPCAAGQIRRDKGNQGPP